LAIEGCSRVPRDIERAQRLPASRIERDQLVSGGEPDVLTVVRDSMHLVDTRKRSILSNDFDRGSIHASILITRQGRRE
jgi:hypothetical protein